MHPHRRIPTVLLHPAVHLFVLRPPPPSPLGRPRLSSTDPSTFSPSGFDSTLHTRISQRAAQCSRQSLAVVVGTEMRFLTEWPRARDRTCVQWSRIDRSKDDWCVKIKRRVVEIFRVEAVLAQEASLSDRERSPREPVIFLHSTVRTERTTVQS